MSEQHHEEAHNGPISNPKQMMWVSIFAFVVPVFMIIGLVFYVTTQNKPAAGASNLERATAERIQKVGAVAIMDANREPRTGEEVFKNQCSTCHAVGALGAPKFGDKGAWAPRVGKGFEALLTSALKGKGGMAPQGGGEYSDFEVGRAVVYMANTGGGKLTEPKAPAAAK